LGQRHVETRNPILYTSADSVIQIAAHESIIPPEQLYDMCHYARGLADDLNVGRVIARPFTGVEGSFERTSRRKDYAMEPPLPNLLSQLQQSGVKTIGVGKIGDIFSGQGLTRSYPDKGNEACLERMETLWNEPQKGHEFIFVNLVDTDMIYGHRRDPHGYGKAVEQIDEAIGRLQATADIDKQLIITADHGCDPTWRGSDHTRECVPFLQWQATSTVEEIGLKVGFRYCADRILATFSQQLGE
jgi:phosphopentomutase